MEEVFLPIVIVLIIFGTFFGIMYLYYTTRNRERMALIEKNADPSIIKSAPRGTFTAFVIKLGMLFAGAGIGTLIGNIFAATTSLNDHASYISMIFLFAGAGLVASYYISRKALKSK